MVLHAQEIRARHTSPHNSLIRLSHGKELSDRSFPIRHEKDVGKRDGKRVQDQDRDGCGNYRVLKERFHVARVVFDSWYWSEKLVKGSVVSELKSNRRLIRVRPLEGGKTLGVEGHPHVGDLPPGSYLAELTLGDQVITIKLLILVYKDNRLNLYTTDLNLSDEEIEATWKIRWEIEKLHKDIKALGMQDSSFLKRKRLQGYLLLFVMVVNTVRDLISSLNLKSVEELLRFVEIRLGGALGLMKIFKLR